MNVIETKDLFFQYSIFPIFHFSILQFSNCRPDSYRGSNFSIIPIFHSDLTASAGLSFSALRVGQSEAMMAVTITKMVIIR
jgi:hypothetical protein